MGSEKGVEFAVVGRRVILTMEGKVGEAGGGKYKFLNGESKTRDRISPVLPVLVREFVHWHVLPGLAAPQVGEIQLLNIVTLLFSPPSCPCRTVSIILFVFQNFALLKLKSHLYNFLVLFGLGNLNML